MSATLDEDDSRPHRANVARCCGSCPFRADVTTTCFKPDVLDATIGDNLRRGYAHHCHQTNDAPNPKVCAGFLRFVHREGIQNRMVQLGERWRLFGPVDEAAPIIAGGWEAILDAHRQRLEGT